MKGKRKRYLAFVLTWILALNLSGFASLAEGSTEDSGEDITMVESTQTNDESESVKMTEAETNLESNETASESSETEMAETETSESKSMETMAVMGISKTVEVTPGEADFDFSGGVINGLKSTYISGLTNEQKKNIRIIIPKSINGINVTSIADYAFYSNKTVNRGCIFIYLDLAQASDLKSIGAYAFYGYPQLNGSLILPEGLTLIDRYAFAYSGFTGTLTLPSSLTQLNDSAFRQGSATAGFSGKLVIPAGLRSIPNCAFSYQSNITSVEFTGDNLTMVDTSAFRGTGLSGVLHLPESVQTIGKNAFAETKLTTVYIPETAASKASGYLMSNTFGSCSLLKAIVCSASNYSVIYSTLQNAEKAKLGYPVTITFDDTKGGTYPSIDRLFGQTLNMIKAGDENWRVDSTYKLPQITTTGSEIKKWSFLSTGLQGITESTVVSGTTLYAISVLVDPVITYGDDIDTVYDGTPKTLTVNATHPKYKNEKEAKENDVVFYYWWNWATIGPIEYVSKGYDVNEYQFTDVRMPSYAIGCRVTVQAYLVGKGGSISKFYEERHSFSVHLTQADPIVNPVYPKDLIKLSEGMPEISLSQGDTPGSIAWDAGQTLEEGLHEYSWTFTPTGNDVGSCNYKIVKGKAQLNAFDGEIYDIAISSSGSGSVSPVGSLKIGQGQNLTLNLIPDAGYRISSVKLDGQNITSEVKNNKYVLSEINSNHQFDVIFDQIKIEDVKDMINELPEISEGEDVTQEQIDSVLNTVLNMEMLDESSKNDITPEEKAALYDTVAKLPQIETAIDSPMLNIHNKNSLLENMTAEDIQELQKDTTVTMKISVKAEDKQPDQDESVLIHSQIDDAQLAGCFSIEVVKELQTKDELKTFTLSELRSPIKIVLDVPEALVPDESDGSRSFFVVRLHSAGGNTTADILEDEDDDIRTVTISSDKFSTYAIAYKDEPIKPVMHIVQAEAGDHGQISPSGLISVEEGQSQIFTFTPEDGYVVDSILLDGKNVGSANTYTISNVTADHQIKVLFKEVPVPPTQFWNVSFDSFGGSEVSEIKNVRNNAKINKPQSPQKDNCEFTGWYKDKDCTVLWDFEKDTVSQNLTLYAGWKERESESQTESQTESQSQSQSESQKETPKQTTKPDSGNKDQTAKTGDGTPVIVLWIIASTAVVLFGTIIVIKRKKRA